MRMLTQVTLQIILVIAAFNPCNSFQRYVSRQLIGANGKIPQLLRKFGHLSKQNSCQKLHALSSNDDNDDGNKPTFKQVLKEEIEAPFRNVRIFFYFALIAAATLSAVICLTRILALQSLSTEADLTELYNNLAINLAGIPVLAFFWKQDLTNRNKLIERIQRGGNLAGLLVKLQWSPIASETVKLVELRRDRGIDKRVIIVAAKPELLSTSIASSLSLSNNLLSNDLIVIPIQISDNPWGGDNQSGGRKEDGKGMNFRLTPFDLNELVQIKLQSKSTITMTNDARETSIDSISGNNNVINEEDSYQVTKHIGQPMGITAWNTVIGNEIRAAMKQQPDVLEKGITIVIKKNGKVGTRRFGVPIWETLIDDVLQRKEYGLDTRNI
jgi:hypothetical protein